MGSMNVVEKPVRMPVIGLPKTVLRGLEAEAERLSTTPSGLIEALVIAFLAARAVDWRRGLVARKGAKT